jgi:uncharacterized membrane protein YeaQ/YmgE (transglycosylase-associated protein family)
MTLGTILWWILIGFVAGAIAKLIMPGKDPGGWIITILLGIAGAFVGGWLFGMLGIGGGGFTTLIGAIIGALILLAIYRLIAGRRPA